MAVWQCGSCMRDNGKVPFPYRHWNLLPIWNISILMNATQLCCVLPVLGWRKTIKSNREEKEQFENNFSNFERRNQNSISPVSRREREIRQNIINFREEKEKGIFFAQALRREIFNTFLQFWEEKENIEIIFFYFESRITKGRGKPRVISLREFLELKTLVKVLLLQIISTAEEEEEG